MKKGLTILGFEAEHRGGKGTQIKIIKDLFDALNISCFIARGAIYRSGYGNLFCDGIYWDPASEYWKKTMKKYPLINIMSEKERNKFEKNNIKKLHQDLILFKSMLNNIKNATNKNIVLVLDRTDISNFFWLRKMDRNILFEEFKNLLGGNLVIPDCTFYLDIDKEILISRNIESNETNLSLKNERLNTVLKYHELYEKTIFEMQKYGFQVETISGGESIQIVSERIFQVLLEKNIL